MVLRKADFFRPMIHADRQCLNMAFSKKHYPLFWSVPNVYRLLIKRKIRKFLEHLNIYVPLLFFVENNTGFVIFAPHSGQFFFARCGGGSLYLILQNF